MRYNTINYLSIMFSIVSISLFLFLLYICESYAVHNVIIVLGSHDNNILNERVYSTMDYINNTDNLSILYLSGGVKDAFKNDNSESEAFKMNEQFSSIYNIEIVQDQLAQNTAENFAYLKQWVYKNYNIESFPNIVISTSDFHKKRAELIFNGIFPEVEPIWNLSVSECVSCWNDERIHIKNVDNDILKTKHITLYNSPPTGDPINGLLFLLMIQLMVSLPIFVLVGTCVLIQKGKRRGFSRGC